MASVAATRGIPAGDAKRIKAFLEETPTGKPLERNKCPSFYLRKSGKCSSTGINNVQY